MLTSLPLHLFHSVMKLDFTKTQSKGSFIHSLMLLDIYFIFSLFYFTIELLNIDKR